MHENTYIFMCTNTNVAESLHVKIDDEISRAFRKAVIDKFGSKKGALTRGIEEAILIWLENEGYKEDVEKLRDTH